MDVWLQSQLLMRPVVSFGCEGNLKSIVIRKTTEKKAKTWFPAWDIWCCLNLKKRAVSLQKRVWIPRCRIHPLAPSDGLNFFNKPIKSMPSTFINSFLRFFFDNAQCICKISLFFPLRANQRARYFSLHRTAILSTWGHGCRDVDFRLGVFEPPSPHECTFAYLAFSLYKRTRLPTRHLGQKRLHL